MVILPLKASSSSLSPDILNSMRSGRYNDGSPSITGNNDGPTGSGQNDINAPSRYYEAPQDYIGDEASPGPAMELVSFNIIYPNKNLILLTC